MNTSGSAKLYEKKRIIIIPCYNEEGRIKMVLQDIKNMSLQADILVINDASTDNTQQEALSNGATVLSHTSKLGYGAALETGYLYAVQNNYDILLQMDGDGQHIAKELPKILHPILLDKTDIVIGSRYAENGSPIIKIPFLRLIGHRLFAWIIKFSSGLDIKDPTSGFQAMNRKAFQFLIENGFPCDYPDSDVIIMAVKSGLRVMEIPVQMRERISGKSMHSGLRPLYYAIKMLLSIFIVLLNSPQWAHIKNNQKGNA